MTFGLVPGFSGNIFVTILITLILELIVYLLWFRKDLVEVSAKVILINLFTVPLANFVYGEFFNSTSMIFLFIELGVILVETYLVMLLFKIKSWKALILSFVANAVSAFLGIFFYLLIV